MFNPGDRVKLVGVVKDCVTDTPSGRVSVLVETEESPSKEYWLQEAHLVVEPVIAPPGVDVPPADWVGKTVKAEDVE
jgi:hypothetical protein